MHECLTPQRCNTRANLALVAAGAYLHSIEVDEAHGRVLDHLLVIF
jgi:hypothetical protein